jgi:prophage regulatory protein
MWVAGHAVRRSIMTDQIIQSGARCLSPKKACEKLDRRKSWLWDRVKNDPGFPKPIYLSAGSPVFLEHELDAYIANRVRA